MGVSLRYARALFSLAQEEGDPSECLQDLKALQPPLQDEALKDLLRNPALPVNVKRDIVFSLAQRLAVRPTTIQFLGVLTERDRIAILPDVLRQYEKLLQRAMGLVLVRIVSAGALERSEREGLLGKIRAMVGRELVIQEEIEPDLIAGIQVEVEGKVYDGSLKGQLEKMKERIALTLD